VDEYESLVEQLARKDQAQAALQALLAAGSAATPAVRRGLRHDEPVVRMRCCMVLDHHLDDAAIPELVANLDHPDGRVRSWALHALTCEQCKEDQCGPAEDEVVPIALRMLREDRSRKVRTMAASMLGSVAHRRKDAARALEVARDGDRHPVVRQVAGWYAPGGQVYRRLAQAAS
jgi:HEAT repeats